MACRLQGGSQAPQRSQLGHVEVSFRGILKCFLYDSLYKTWCLCSRLEWIQIIFFEQGLQVRFIFSCFGGSFFVFVFLLVFWKVLEGSFGGRMAHFGSILRSFGSHFFDFLGIRWISENVCFTVVKH